MFIQNQRAAGNLTKRWDKDGVLLEDLDFNKHSVKVDGSRRVTNRKRSYLRNFKPAIESSSYEDQGQMYVYQVFFI